MSYSYRCVISLLISSADAPNRPRKADTSVANLEVDDDENNDSLPSIFRADSPLSKAGYTVSEKGQLTDPIKRHKLLADFCRSNDIPKVGNASYMKQWGQGGSKKRVLCVAHHINWLINYQGAKGQNEDARSRWELDLKWLKKTYSSQFKKIEWP